jgi:hypothetical protein
MVSFETRGCEVRDFERNAVCATPTRLKVRAVNRVTFHAVVRRRSRLRLSEGRKEFGGGARDEPAASGQGILRASALAAPDRTRRRALRPSLRHANGRGKRFERPAEDRVRFAGACLPVCENGGVEAAGRNVANGGRYKLVHVALCRRLVEYLIKTVLDGAFRVARWDRKAFPHAVQRHRLCGVVGAARSQAHTHAYTLPNLVRHLAPPPPDKMAARKRRREMGPCDHRTLSNGAPAPPTRQTQASK